HRGGVVQYSVDHSRCLRSKGRTCAKCLTACSEDAVIGRKKSEDITIRADAALVATGHAAYEATGKPALGYGRLPGVMTGEEAESELSNQTFLGDPSADVAFVQCVGSRDPEIGRNYCSSVCCAYATRMAKALKARNPDGRVTVYYIDLQNFDKAFSAFRRKTEEEGVEFVRSVPFAIEGMADGRLRARIENADGTSGTAEHDRIVLSVGMGPSDGAATTADLFGIASDEFGFFQSAPDNVWTAGTCVRPRTIAESMADADASVARIVASVPVRTKASAPTAMNDRALVVGGGIAGCRTAEALVAMGCKVTLVEESSIPGGEAAAWRGDGADYTQMLKGVDTLFESRLTGLSGQVGTFEVAIETGNGPHTVKCGAVIVCTGTGRADARAAAPESNEILALHEIEPALRRMRKRDLPATVGLVLDLQKEEGKAGTEMALRTALDLRRRYHVDPYVFCRDVRVSDLPLEELYDDARQGGVNIVKHRGAVTLEPLEEGVMVRAEDSVLREELPIPCGLVGISEHGLRNEEDGKLAALLGVRTDVQGRMQDNNLHLYPGLTNRPGIFVSGACRGQDYVPDIETESRATAAAVSALLSGHGVTYDSPAAEVDASLCALCLTCVRSCPHGAMIVDGEKRSALAVPEVCRRCGVCVGECPAGAIELAVAAG
ncbi:MAG: FAD-dependent oxidoreductase, partial [Lentisphaerae bacterium]|nr:FAD-dependent oxidoreductase [Lentisphaerota bacterium]